MIAALLLLAFVFSPPLFGPVRLGDLLVPPLAAWLWMRTREDRPILRIEEKLYLAFLAWASLVAVGTLISGINGRAGGTALTLLRWFELGAVYALGARMRGDARFVERGAAVSICGLSVWGAYEGFERLIRSGEPFFRAFNEGFFAGEANHVAGALVVCGIAAPLFSPVALCAVMLSGSRIAFAAAVVAFLRNALVSGRHRLVAALVLVCGGAAVLSPDAALDRFSHVLEGRGPYRGPHVDRVEAWTVVLDETPFWTGAGPGSRHSSMYESAYAMLYAETGAPGLALYLAALLALVLLRDVAGGANDWRAGLAIALLIMGLTADVGVIARIAGPAFLVLGLSRIRPSHAPAASGAPVSV
jgi:hypothetical protein